MSNKILAGRYELIEKIGEGGMAIVYKGKDILLNRYVAIKILRLEYTKDEQFIDNFRKESQAAAGLTHPNIVGVYDVGKEGNIHFIVMELIEGKALSEIIKEKGKLDYKEAMDITRQVASALSLAHRNQVVHRDVKPHNIMITNQGVAKLADFGIARAVSAATIAGDSNKVMGSVHYFSPEQARGAYVDERSDIYSLGIVLYEMLTGKVPFDGDSAVSIALMHINDPIPSLSESVQGLPPQLDRIVQKATDKYQNNRFKSADEVIEALDDIEFITKVMGPKAFLGAGSSSAISEVDEPDIKVDNKHIRANENKAKKKDESFNKKFKIAIIAGGSILVIAMLILLGFLLGWFGKSTKEITVPSFVGMTLEEAQAAAEEKGLVIEEGDEVYSPDLAEGLITSQNPVAQSKVSEGKVITVNISKGMKDGVVPSLIGKNYNEAKSYLESLGFTLGVVVKETSTEPKDTIIGQSVKAGTSAEKGTEIDVTVSDGKGKEKVKMPNLIGKTPEEAKSILAANGLQVGEVSYEETDDTAQNLIFWQQYKKGAELDADTYVSYKVSKGEPPKEDENSGSDNNDNDNNNSGDNGGKKPDSGNNSGSESEPDDSGNTGGFEDYGGDIPIDNPTGDDEISSEGE